MAYENSEHAFTLLAGSSRLSFSFRKKAANLKMMRARVCRISGGMTAYNTAIGKRVDVQAASE